MAATEGRVSWSYAAVTQYVQEKGANDGVSAIDALSLLRGDR
jgi:hypothetical protein